MNGPPLTNMKALRTSLNLTQEAFAKTLGISKTTYNNYETGAREPGHDFIINVALKYDVSTDYLLGLSNSPICKSAKKLAATALEPEEMEIALAYRNATEEIRGIVRHALDKYMDNT